MDEFNSIQPTLVYERATIGKTNRTCICGINRSRTAFDVVRSQRRNRDVSPLLFLFSGSHSIDPCASKYCGIGKECELSPNNTIAVCVCMRKCPRRHRPVCASNGKIYANHCELHRAACHSSSSLTKSRLMRCLHHGKN